MKRLTLALLLAAALAGGCGKSSRTASSTTTVAPGGSTTTTAKGATTTTARGATTTTAKGATTTTAKGATTTTVVGSGPTTTVPTSARTDRACVHPGDTQGLTVTGQPRAKVIYDTVYSDGTDQVTVRYGSGYGRGDADDNGYFHVTWTMPLNAPAGPAVVNVGMTNGQTFSQPRAPFTIKAVGVPC